MNIKKYLLFIVLVSGFVQASFAQSSGVSPYSRLGIGDIVTSNLQDVRNMGGTGISYTDIYHINPSNPASYAYLRSSAFNIGMYAKNSTLTDASSSVNLWNGNINNLSLAFPMRNPINDILDRVHKKYSWGMAFHLVPHSTVGYDLQSTENTEELGDFTRYYNGDGGTYKFLWGNALRYNDISFGLHLGYLFGNITNTKTIIFDDITYGLNDYFSTDYHVSGFVWDAGLMYTLKLNEKEIEENDDKKLNKLVFGLTFKSNNSFTTSSNILNVSSQFITGVGDTLVNDTDIEGEGVLPGSIGFGVNYFNGTKYSIGVNYEYENWADFENDANKTAYDDAYRVSVGGYYRPNASSYGNFLKRVKYQYGIYYRKDPRTYQAETDAIKSIESYGLTLGLGMPFVFKRKISHADIGVDFGYQGKNSPIEEQYLKINFGFTFNDDGWFMKRKYN